MDKVLPQKTIDSFCSLNLCGGQRSCPLLIRDYKFLRRFHATFAEWLAAQTINCIPPMYPPLSGFSEHDKRLSRGLVGTE
jgi:hypothetical protein